jgi:tRNA(adenine34) deaminase
MAILSDEDYMQRAIALALQAQSSGEVPVGAVVVNATGEVIGEGANATISRHDVTAHAEILALRAAGQQMRNYRLPGCSLFVTLEPCAMCLGAIFHARLSRVMFATPDPKTGACGSAVDLANHAKLNHHTFIDQGVLKETCSHMLSQFFKQKRQKVV